MSVTDPAASTRDPTAGVDWASTDHAVCDRGPTASRLGRFTVTHDAAGLRTLIRAPARAPESTRSGSNARDGPVVDALRAGRADRLRHPARPGEEPALAVRLGREQGRPLRRLRPGRRGAHRPPPAAPAAGRPPGTTASAPARARAP